MPQTFDCPACGAPLDYQQGTAATMRCPYCNNSVIIPNTLAAPAAPEIAGLGDLSQLISEAMGAAQSGHFQELGEIARLARAGNKIEAIKLYRDTFQTGLLGAKNAVEALDQAQPKPAAPLPRCSSTARSWGAIHPCRWVIRSQAAASWC